MSAADGEGSVLTWDSPELLLTKQCCNHCKKVEAQADTFKRCGRCLANYYCSVECQRADWKEHKEECKYFAAGSGKAVLDAEYVRWKHKFYNVLCHLVHTVLGPDRTHTHVVFMEVVYHTGQKPGFEVSFAEGMLLDHLRMTNPDMHEDISAQMADLRRFESDFKHKNGYALQPPAIAVVNMRHAGVGMRDEDPNGVVRQPTFAHTVIEGEPRSRDGIIKWLNSHARPQ